MQEPEYVCLNEDCKHEFTLEKPPPMGTDCPACGHEYVKWTNWREFIR